MKKKSRPLTGLFWSTTWLNRLYPRMALATTLGLLLQVGVLFLVVQLPSPGQDSRTRERRDLLIRISTSPPKNQTAIPAAYLPTISLPAPPASPDQATLPETSSTPEIVTPAPQITKPDDGSSHTAAPSAIPEERADSPETGTLLPENKSSSSEEAQQTIDIRSLSNDERFMHLAAGHSQPAPRYPAAARRWEMEATVRLEIRIAANGQVSAAEIIASSGFRILDNEVKNTVENSWSFQAPGYDISILRDFNFSLTGN